MITGTSYLIGTVVLMSPIFIMCWLCWHMAAAPNTRQGDVRLLCLMSPILAVGVLTLAVLALLVSPLVVAGAMMMRPRPATKPQPAPSAG